MYWLSSNLLKKNFQHAGGCNTNTLASFEQGLTIYIFIADSHLKCFSKDLLLVAGTYRVKQSSPAR